jgi:hypothetical protein
VPGTAIDGAGEIVRAAGQTGARMHYCHVNSTSQRHIRTAGTFSQAVRLLGPAGLSPALARCSLGPARPPGGGRGLTVSNAAKLHRQSLPIMIEVVF